MKERTNGITNERKNDITT